MLRLYAGLMAASENVSLLSLPPANYKMLIRLDLRTHSRRQAIKPPYMIECVQSVQKARVNQENVPVCCLVRRPVAQHIRLESAPALGNVDVYITGKNLVATTQIKLFQEPSPILNRYAAENML